MDRRKFLASSLAAAAASSGLSAAQQPAAAAAEREYYELRSYHIINGPQKMLADSYFRDALIPALNRLGIARVGVFNTTVGDAGAASCYVLLPAAKAETLVTLEAHLADDAEYQKAGSPFLNAPARDPGFVRMESALLYAFESYPKLAPFETTGPRMFEIRTYESTTPQDHIRKIEQMNSGEAGIFKKAGLWPVFLGDRLMGGRLPSLTYMLAFATLADREKNWLAFQTSPEWKALSSEARFTFEPLVSNVDNVFLNPAAYSQI